MAAVSGQSIITPYVVQMDATVFYADEIAGAKTDIEAHIPNYTVKSFVPPGDYTSATGQAAVKAAGHLIMRGNTIWDANQYDLSNLGIFHVIHMEAFSTSGVWQDSLARQTAASLFNWLPEYGGIVMVYAHGTDQYSIDEWKVLFEEAAKTNVKVLSMREAADYIINNGTTTDGGTTYARTWTDQSDYHLQSTSPLINAGTNLPWSGVANVTDFAGTAITDGSGVIIASGGRVDIGAYEYLDGNGACGSNNTAHFYTLASGEANNCSAGIETNFTGSGPWTWYCAGSNGGTDSGTCTANLPPPIVINAESTTIFTAMGGLGTFDWSIAGSPAWFTITGRGRGNSTGTLTFTGMPPANLPVTVQVTDGYGTASITETVTLVDSAPGAPTGVTATAGDGQALVSFTAPVSDGGISITSYTVTSNPGYITATGSSSPITVTGLTNGTAYTFTVTAANAAGIGSTSAPSDSVTPSVMSQPTPVPAAFPIPLAGTGLILFMMLRRRAKK